MKSIIHNLFQFFIFIVSETLSTTIYLKYYEMRSGGISKGILFLFLFGLCFIIPSIVMINLIDNLHIKISIICVVILLMLYHGIKLHPLKTLQYILCYLCSQILTFYIIFRKIIVNKSTVIK